MSCLPAGVKDITWFQGIILDRGKKERDKKALVALHPWILPRNGF